MIAGVVHKRLAEVVKCAVSAAALALAGVSFAGAAFADINPPWILPHPKFVKPVTTKPAPGSKVNVVADLFTYDSRSKIATARGTVVITYGAYTLTATRVEYDTKTGRFKANGSIALREPNGNEMQASYAELYNKFREGFAEHVTALLTNDVTITAQYARRTANGVTYYTRATYTACKDCVSEGGTPAWQIRAREAKHDEKNQTIYYKDMNLDIAGVPVLWLPYLAYPDPTVTRRTGFLLPQFKSASSYGLGVQAPFFWAVSPSSDLTLTPMLTTKQGVLADAEWRQRLSNGSYNIHGYGIYQLDPSQTSDSSRWRGAVSTSGDFKLNSVWSAGWNGTWQTDRAFLSDYSINKDDLITNEAHATALYDRSYVNIEALNFQTTLPSILPDGSLNREDQRFLPTAVPFITADHTFADAFFGGELSMDFASYALHRDSAVNFADTQTFLGTDQDRMVGELHWQRQIITGMGQLITPFTGLRSDIYVSHNVPGAPGGEQSATDVLPMAGVDMRWPFVGSLGSGQSVITPVAQIISAPLKQDTSLIGNEDAKALNFDHTSLFLEDKYSGYDRYESGTRANLGLMYSYLMNDGGFIRASGGYTQHIAGDNTFQPGSGLDTNVSDFVAGLAYQPNDKLRFTYEARLNPQLTDINAQEASASLTLDRIAGSISYANVPAAPAYGLADHEEQLWGDVSYRLTTAWSVFGGLRYDLAGHGFIDKEIGVIFDCDCMTAKLSYTDHTGSSLGDPSDKSLMLSVELRTLGKIAGGFSL